MKKNLFFRAIIFTIILIAALPGNSYAWGPDVVVNPVAGNYYSKATISVAYDGTLYYGRLYSTISASGPMQHWEILKSVDNGAVFTDYKSGYVTGSIKFIDFDILAAGNDAATFNLFIARSYLDTVNRNSKMRADRYDISGTSTTIIDELYVAFSTIRGWGNLSMVSDYREKNVNSSPYSFSIAAVKSEWEDSIVVWTDQLGGTVMNRRGIASSPQVFRNVSIAIGKAGYSQIGRLGVVWDSYTSGSFLYGTVRCKYVYPDSPADIISGGGPFLIGSAGDNYRNPVIVMSQKATGPGTGIGDRDIRTIIFYEYSDGTINARVADSIMTITSNFSSIFQVAQSSKKGTNLDAIYDPYNEEFLITYYDQTNKMLSYSTKSLISPKNEAPAIIRVNYRDVLTVSTVAVNPRVDINKTDGNVVFAWNDSGASMFETYVGSASIDENSMESVSNLLLYPNPATDHVNIVFNSISEQKIKLYIYDLRGSEVYATESQVIQGENLLEVNTDNLAQGQYVLMVSSANNSYPVKLIIK